MDARNVAWLKRLRPLLEEGGAAINVGASHLGARGGLIELLNADGIRIQIRVLLTQSQSM